MDNKFSVDDILLELESKRSQKTDDGDFEKIMDEILGRTPSAPKTEKVEDVAPKKAEEPVKVEASKPVEPKKPDIKQEAIKEKEEQPRVKQQEPAKIEEPVIDKTQSVEEKIEEKKEFKVNIKYEDEHPEFEDKTIQMPPFGIEEEKDVPLENPGVNDDLIKFKESRKDKVERFVLFGDEEEETEPEPVKEEENIKVIEDFNDYSETDAFVKDISSIKASLTLRFIILAALSVISLYIELSNRFSLPRLEIFNKDLQPLSYLIVGALVFLAAVIVSAPAIFGGLSSLFKFKSDGDSMLAVSVIGTVVQYVSLFAVPGYISTARNAIFIYSVITIFGMLLNTVGKILIINKVKLNFRFVSGGYEKYAVTMPESEKLETFVKEQFDAPYAGVAIPRKTDFIGNFFSYSYREDISDNVSKIISPILALGAVVLAIVSFIMSGDICKAATTFSAVTAVCVPLSVMICVNLPVLSTVKKIVTRGCMISGLPACNEIYDTNAVLIKSADLFPKGSIQLSSIKTFAAGKIDDVILDAASVVIRAESDLSDVFLSVIGGRKDLLRPVDSIVYEESMGLGAWVDSKRILIGNRELIAHHGIDVPSKDYEKRYLSDGMDTVYLAESGQLVAVFLIQYKPGKQIKNAMKALKELGVGVVVASTDPNIDAAKIASIFDVNEEMIKTVPADKQGETEKLTKPVSRENVGSASISSFTSFVQTIYAAIKLKNIAALAVSLQTVGVIIGFALMAFFTIASGNVSVSVETVLLYQLFWLLIVTIVPSFRKVKI